MSEFCSEIVEVLPEFCSEIFEILSEFCSEIVEFVINALLYVAHVSTEFPQEAEHREQQGKIDQKGAIKVDHSLTTIM